MSSQTVVDVVVSGTTATVVDARVDGVTTVAGAAPVTTVSGQVPDVGVITDFRTENITLTSDGFNILSGNLVSTGEFLTDEIAIVSGIAGGQDLTNLSGTVDTLSGNVIATGQYLTSEIAIVSGLAGGQDIDTLSGNLIETGQYLTEEIAIVSGLTTGSSSDPALSGKVDTLSGNLIATGAIVDDVSGNLITTGQTLEDKKFDKAGGIISGNIIPNDTETIDLGSSTKKWDNIYARDGHFDSGTLFLGTAGANIKVVDNRIQLEGDSATKGPQFQGNVIINDGTLTISGNLAVTANQTGILATADNLVTTGQTLQTQITSNDSDISTLTTNLISTGQTLSSEIAIVSGIATGGSEQDFRELSGNLITTGQTLQTQITSNDSDISTLTTNLIATGNVVDGVSGNLITTGQTLQTQITSNDSDISTITNNLVTTGQTLQTQITSNDSDISTLTSNLITTGQTLTSEIAIVSGIATGGSEQDFRELSGNLITTGQTLQTQITNNDSDISTLTSNLVTTGQTLTTNVNTVSSNLVSTGKIIDDVSGNLITTGQTLQTQITSNDGDITTLTSNLVTTGQTLTTNINTVSTNLVSTGKVIDDVSGNLITTGQTLQTQITSNDGDISTLTSNLVTTGQTLTTNVNTVSTNLISTGAVVDDISGNLITTGQTLQTQITSNDGDITTLTSNLVTTGQTLTTNINTVATNLGTSGQTLQTQITSNDSDISTLTSNLGTTGQTLQTQITSNDSDIASLTTNLGTTGQTLQTQITSNDSDISTLDSTTVKLTTNQSIAGNKIFTNDVTINNLTVTGTEVVVDVENLAVKDNIIEINSGESGAGISRISGGIVIDRGTATNANILYNDANDRFELNFPLAVEGEVVASASNLITTGQTLTTNINTVSTNLGTSGQTLQTQITSNDSDISTLTTNLVTTGQTLQTQITSNDSDISTLTTNLGTTGQTLQTQITSNDSDISALTSNLVSTGSVVDDISGNLITTGQTLQTQITSNDADITTLTSNLVTTGQTLTTNINTVSTNLISTGKVVDDISGNLITTGQTLQTQITSNDTDITNLSSNLVTTGQTLTTNINTVATNLVTTGQTLTSEIATVSGLIPATVIDGGGTANTVPLWSDANTIGDSVISQSSSKIGIGTNAPAGKLEIVGSNGTVTGTPDGDAEELVIRNNDRAGIQILSANNAYGSLIFGSASDINGANIFYAPAAKLLTIGTQVAAGEIALRAANGAEAVRIDADGKVGIGTNAPSEKLDVEGSLVVNVANSGLGEEGIFFRRGFSDSNKYNISILAYAHDGAGNFSDGISINGYDGVSFCTGASTRQERMRIVGGTGGTSGFVGIGTNAPATTLEASGTIRSTAFLPKIQLKRTGNAVANGDIEWLGNDDSVDWSIRANYDSGGDNFNIKEGSTSRLYIKSGNVSIGTTSTAYGRLFVDAATNAANTALAVRGRDSSASYIALNVMNNADGAIFTVLNNGKAEITTAQDSVAPLTLKSTYNGSTAGPLLDLYRKSGTPSDGDNLGTITFTADTNVGSINEFARIESTALDVTDTTEDGALKLAVVTAGTLRSRIYMDATETVFNDASQDFDFRVESNNSSHALFVRGSDSAVGVGTAAPNAGSWSNAVTIQGASSVGLELMKGSSLYAFMGVQGSGSSHALDIAAYQNQSIRLRVGSNAGTTAVTIENGGAIQIGTDGTARELRWANTFANNGPTIIGHDINGTFQFYPAGNGSGEVLKLASNGAITFNNAFTFPTADGSAGQVLQTNGSGTVTWATVSGGGGVSGSGTDHYIPRWNGTTALQDSAIIALDSGSVGIGVAAPDSTLHVAGDIKSKGDGKRILLESNDYLVAALTRQGTSGSAADQGGLEIYNAGTTKVALFANTTSYINNGANFGIGSTNPYAYDTTATKFEVSTGTTTVGEVEVARFRGGDDADTGAAIVRITNDNDRGLVLKGGRTGTAAFADIGVSSYDGSFTRGIRIDGAGRVGIGTVSPFFKCDIHGGSSVPLRLVSSGYAGTEYHNTAGTWVAYVGTESGGGGNRYNSAASKHTFYNNSSAVVTINSSGSVGIGTVTPAVPLHITKSAVGDNEIPEVIRLSTLNSASPSWSTTDGLCIGAEMKKANGTTITKQPIRFRYDGGDMATTFEAGNVGIGTDQPLNLLMINGSSPIIRFRDSNASGTPLAYIDASDGALKLQADASDETASSFLTLEVDGSEHVRVIADGNVGIGTNNPGEMLQVGDGSVNSTSIEINSASWAQLKLTSPNTNGAYIMFGDPEDEDIGNIFYYHGSNANYMSFTTNASEQMRIDKNGNVGIGTNNPGYLLHIQGTGPDLFKLRATTAGSATAPKIHFEHSSGGTQTANIIFDQSGQNKLVLSTQYQSATDENLIQFAPADNVAMTIRGGTGSSDGFVGIGLTDPDAKLEIKGTAGSTGLTFKTTDSSSNNTFWIQDGGKAGLHYYPFVINQDNSDTDCPASTFFYVHHATAPFIIKNDGKVGIGINAPATKLDVYHATDSQITVSSNSDSSGDSSLALIERSADSAFGAANTFGFQWKYDGGDNKLYLSSGNQTSVVNRLTIQRDDGNVGIGTVAPASLLHVGGAAASPHAAADDFVIAPAATDVGMTIRCNSNAGTGSIFFADTAANAQGLIRYNHNSDYMSFYSTGDFFFDGSSGADVLFRINTGNTETDARLMIGEADNYGMTFEYDGVANMGYLGMNNNVAPTGAWSKRIQMSRSGTEVAFMAGRVGIGTASPAFPFEIRASNLTNGDAKRVASFFDTTSSTTGTGGGIALGGWSNGGASPVDDFAVIQGIKENATAGNYASAMLFSTRANGAAPAEQMRITSAGSVGIGTNSPDVKLSVRDSTADLQMRIGSLTAGRDAKIRLQGKNTANSANRYADIGLDAENGLLQFWTPKTSTPSVVAVSINSSANVGIGTDAPAAKLEVQGLDVRIAAASPTSDAHYLRLKHDNSEGIVDSNRGKLKLQSNDDIVYTLGSVGVGTDAPSRPLHVYVTSGNNYLTVQNTSASQAALQLMTGTTDANWVMYIPSSSTDLRLYRGADKVVFKADGNVGIGITPTRKFHVYGSASSAYLAEFTNTHSTAGYGVLIKAGDDNNVTALSVNDKDGNEKLRVRAGGQITFANAFTFPTADGSANQMLKTDGSGNLSWTSAGSGTVTGSGTDHYIPRWNGTTALQNSAIISLDSGSVGIGTNSPNDDLNIHDTSASANLGIKITRGTQTHGLRIGVNDSHAFVWTDQSQSLAFATNNTERLTILSGGSVGIGTNSPLSKLNVLGSQGNWRVDPDSVSNEIQVLSTTVANDGFRTFRLRTNETVFDTGGSERMRINAAGKVIINDTATTNNNNAQLYVNGPVYGSEFDLPSGGVVDWANGDARIAEGLSSNYSLSLQNYDGSSAMVTTMFLKSGGNVGIGTVAPAAHLHVSKAAGTTTVLTQVAAGSTVGYEIKKTGSTTQHWKIVDGQTANGYLEIYDATDSATRMAFNTNGNVGIGTVNAGQLLTIKGDGKYFGAYASDGSLAALLGTDANGDGQLLLADVNGTTKVLLEAEADANSYINNGGNFGLGTAAPAAPLDVQSANGSSVGIRVTNGYKIQFLNGSNNTNSNIYNNGASGVAQLDFQIAGATKVTIDNDGNVGIGTNNPVQRLHLQSPQCIVRVVSTTANSNSSIWFNSNVGGTNADRWEIGTNISAGSSLEIYDRLNGASRMVVKNDGNVGIGTNAPLDKLDVYGTGAIFRNLSDNADSVQIVRGTNHTASPDAKFYIYDNSSADWAAKINLDGGSYGLDIQNGSDFFLLCRKAGGDRLLEVHGSQTIVNGGGIDYDFIVEGNNDDYLLFTEGSTDRVAISTTAPAAKLHVEGDFKVGTTNNGNWMGYKDVTLNGTTYTTALTINLANHTGCYVKLFLSGDWSSHSAVAFVGEYFVQNGGDGYAEPGTVISEFDNTNTDSIESKIVDPSSDTFTIQLKLSTAANGTLGGKLSYHVMGMATAVS